MTLSVVAGWGSAQGFTDLTSASSASHIHGPTAANNGSGFTQTAGVLSTLTRSSSLATGGTFAQGVVLTSQQQTDLFNGKDYINIHTTNNGGGEVRGFLVPTLAPTVTTPTSASITTITATLGGNVTSDGGAPPITERGVVYAVTTTNADPLIGGVGVTKLVTSGTTGVFTAAVTGLTANTGYSFKAYAINSTGTTYTAPVATFSTLSVQQGWRQQFFGTTANTGNAADTADPDVDGIVNLLEYATGLNPTTSNSLVTPAVKNGSNLEFTYPRSVAAQNAGTTFTVEWSDTLAANSYSTTGVSEVVLSTTSGVQQVKATLPAGSNGRRFVRLKVTAAP